MKSSYTQTPRTMQSATWIEGGQAIFHYPESGTQKVYGYLLAIGIGIGLALALVSWWSA